MSSCLNISTLTALCKCDVNSVLMSQAVNKCCFSPPGEVCKVQTLCGPQHTCYQCAMEPWRQPLGDSRWGWHVPHDLGPRARRPPGIQTVRQRGVGYWERGWWRQEINFLWGFYSSHLSVTTSESLFLSLTRLRQRCDQRERDQLHHQGLIDQHAPNDGCETPLTAEGALCGWKVFVTEAAVELLSSNTSKVNKKEQKKASPAFFRQLFLSCVKIPILSLPFWSNSAFSALLLSFNGCPSVIILLRSFIPLEDKGWSGKFLWSYTLYEEFDQIKKGVGTVCVTS